MIAAVVLPMFLGAVLGVAAHRAGLCTVKAVAEIMTTGQAHVLWSFLKASLWTVSLLALATALGAQAGLPARPVSLIGVAGGLCFGIGAALNGACSFSTMSRLAEGHSVMLATLLGWALGMLALRGLIPEPQMTRMTGFVGQAWLIYPAIAWILWEGGRIALRALRQGRVMFEGGFLPLSLGVLLLALANTGLLLDARPWSFTATALCSTGAARLASCAHPGTLWLVSLTALGAMVLSARWRGSFRLRAMRWQSGLRRLAAGAMMGGGAAMIPGGNDGLILFGLPALSPHALPAYAAIVAGIWLALVFMRGLGARVPAIRCEGDICRANL